MANKSELVKRISTKVGSEVPTAAVADVVEAFMTSVIEIVAEGQEITLRGFGNFEARDRSARTGRHPKTGELMSVPAKTIPLFRPSDPFKNAVTEGFAARATNKSRTKKGA